MGHQHQRRGVNREYIECETAEDVLRHLVTDCGCRAWDWLTFRQDR